MKLFSLTLPATLCSMLLFGASCQQSSTTPQNSGQAQGPTQTPAPTTPAQAQNEPAPSTGSMPMGIKQRDFGKTEDGTPVELYTLTNKNGMVVKIMTYGAIITEIHVPDKSGKTADVVLGFNNLGQYLKGHPFFGAIAGRYANRIAKGQFTLDGETYHLPINNGPNSLHGGLKGFDKVVWKAEPGEGPEGLSLTLGHFSPDGDQGYPGNLHTTCTYTLSDDNALKYEVTATTDKDTVVNLTNHSYFNLAGESSGEIVDHILTINAEHYTPVDDTQIPTGEIAPVMGTPFDFTKPTAIGDRIDQVTPGYDHNYVLNSSNGALAVAARLKDPKSGRVMEVWTTQPGVQIYTGNHLDGKLTGIGGKPYQKHDAICLETQHFPDSPNHPAFSSTELKPGDKYDQVTVFKFSAE
jgi:aldose 1-epimerase